jgi:hypothetical protein
MVRAYLARTQFDRTSIVPNKGETFRIVFLEPDFCGAGEDLEVIAFSDLLAGVDVDQHGLVDLILRTAKRPRPTRRCRRSRDRSLPGARGLVPEAHIKFFASAAVPISRDCAWRQRAFPQILDLSHFWILDAVSACSTRCRHSSRS